MRAFTDGPQCEKCGYTFDGDERDAYVWCESCATVQEQDHLHCTCPVCGYTWLMECGDANDANDANDGPVETTLGSPPDAEEKEDAPL